jgi:glycosyltransferase involved in cell wall biosynthesis
LNDLISVIIPVYKVEKYLNRCVESMLRQTYRNLEVILIDDGSPDRCGEICDEFAKVDNRVKVIHKKNGGLSDARNIGIEIAKGDYFTFLDSDDWVHEEYIEKLYTLLIATKSDIAACNFIRTSREEILIDKSNIGTFQFSNIEALDQLTKSHLYVPLVIACGKIYHKDLFEGIRYPINKMHEDEFTAHHLLFKANQIIYTTEQMLFCQKREDSITGSGVNIRSLIHAAQAILDRAEFFDQKGLSKLRDKTYKIAFYMYKKIIEFKNDRTEYVNKEEAVCEFKRLKIKLRKGDHELKFKMFYELYYLMPMIMGMVHKVYETVRGYRKKEFVKWSR